MWWRRRTVLIGVAALVLIVGAAVVLPHALDGGSGQRLRVASESSGGQAGGSGGTGDGTTTSTSQGADGSGVATTTTARPDGSVSSPVQTTTTTTRSGQTTTTTAVDHCRNNNGDPSCGEFHWANDPGANAPLQFEVTWSPTSPKKGEQVTFTAHVIDPDATPINNCGADYDGSGGVGCVHTMECAANYGAWDVPARQRGEATFTYQHTFTASGNHTVTFSAESMQGSKTAGSCAAQPNPYASDGSKAVTVSVTN